MNRFLICFCIVNLFLPCFLDAQTSNSDLKNLVEKLKLDTRGPYKDIRWFCPDGSIIPPKEKCKNPGGFQRARYKDEIRILAENENLFFGQILKGTEKADFYHSSHDHSRMKQYLLEKYLYEIDDGWVQQKSKYYRGAVQAEDEEVWSKEFLEWVLESDKFNEEQYFLIRELVKYLPQTENSNTLSEIRNLSKNISDRVPSFMDLRTKIHGNPQWQDLAAVKDYKSKFNDRLKPADKAELDVLIEKMTFHYTSPASTLIQQKIEKTTMSPEIKSSITSYAKMVDIVSDTEEKLIRAADLLKELKERILSKNCAPKERLALMKTSIVVEQKILTDLSEWSSNSIHSALRKSCYLAQISNSSGHIFDWEFEQLLSVLSNIPEEEMEFEFLYNSYKTTLRNINWGSAMVVAEFGSEVDRFSGFEAKAEGFIDDRIRSSALLYLGQHAAIINDFLVAKAGWKNQIFEKNSSEIQGINPGYAKGTLKVLEQLSHEDLDPKSIYLFRKSPPDLEPVAGILSISEGNLVSHLQLLARNLGIPNANITDQLFSEMRKYDGKEIFYAVSNKGGVVIKLAEQLSEEENALFKTRKIDEEVISVPTEQMKLNETQLYSVEELDASASGVFCGPKAANFARLKKMFPEQLVDGVVIPFSIFKEHMLNQVPGQAYSYWDFLTETFSQVKKDQRAGKNESELEKYTIERLSQLRELIVSMPLNTSFVQDLEKYFIQEFNKPLGEVPVFLRSDTNMEDLKDFTGAGLNLTIFNTVEKEKILKGIKEVWASPYSERSYKWRQKFLTNPEDVYPSILIIPSVFVDYSGVIITKDFIEGTPGRFNVAFSQGAGGAVDGQKSESWMLSPNGQNTLVSPARDRTFKYLSKNGGVASGKTKLSSRLLSDHDISEIWKVCIKIYEEMPSANMHPPYDIELGFENEKLWLFQIRPFVENKKAVSSNYLSTLDPIIPNALNFKLDDSIIQ